jgi:hypothetical protein
VVPLFIWFRDWGVSCASLGGGFCTLFVFRRDQPHVGWIVGYLLLLWFLFAVMTQVRGAVEASGRRSGRLLVTAADYTIQSLCHGLLLFVLPAYWAATTFTSLNAPFFALLVALALVATFDPWYRALVHPRPWLGYVFFIVAVFSALNVALPLVGLPPFASLVASAFLAAVALAPALHRARGLTWREALRTAVAIGVVAAMAVAVGRALIAPVPLFVTDATIGWIVGSVDSLEPAGQTIPATELRERGLVAYTPIYAPAGLSQRVRHVWRQDGKVVEVVELSPVRGGRREGFRTYSRKAAFPADPAGRWTVDVTTSSGQLVGRLSFRVTP